MPLDRLIEFGATVRSLASGLRVFERFQLVRLLGRGGMGMVWLAHDEKLEIDVALKFLPEAVGADEAAAADLARETRHARELAHHHIVRVYDFHQDERLAAISMEWVNGPTLTGHRLAQLHEVFQPPQLGVWIEQVAEALDYAHRRALVVHRDLKPSNLMINAHGDLKVTDFGISASVASSVTRVSRTSSSSGSPPYMSPQQMLGQPPSPADDIYSLGATLYELVTSKPPFFTGNITLQVQSVVPPSIAERRRELGLSAGEIPESWETILAACLSKDPSGRPASAGEVARRLIEPLGPVETAGPVSLAFEPTPPEPKSRDNPDTGEPPSMDPPAVSAEAGIGRSRDGVDAPAHRTGGTRSRGEVHAVSETASTPVSGSPGEAASRRRPVLRWALIVAATALLLGGGGTLAWYLDSIRGEKQEEAAGAGSASIVAEETPAVAGDAPSSVAAVPPSAAAVATDRAFTLRIDPADAPDPYVWIGRSTYKPNDGIVRVPDIADGEYEVGVQARGYQTFSSRLNITSSDRDQEVRLVPVRGRLEIVTTPGARVSAVDDSGRTTQLGMADEAGRLTSDNTLRVGRYTLRFEAENRIAQEVPIQLPVGRAVRVDRLLEPQPGQLRLLSVPTGAKIEIDGVPSGTTPETVENVPVERKVNVRVSHPGYRAVPFEVTLEPGEIRTLNAGTLVVQSGTLELELAGLLPLPDDVRISVDGRDLRPVVHEGKLRLEGLDVGAHHLVVSRPDFRSFEEDLTIRDGATTTVTGGMEPLPAALVLDVRGPKSFETLIDGKSAQVEKGQVEMPVLREVKVTVSASGYRSSSRVLNLAPNATETWSVDLEVLRPETGNPWTVPGLGIEMLWISPGEFTMGSPETEDGRESDEGPQTHVRLTQGYWMDKYEVTQREWAVLMEGNPSWFEDAGDDAPVEQVSWDGALEFCRRLTARERAAGRLPEGLVYTLPTEAQWEYACRAGTTSPLNTGSTLVAAMANFDGTQPYGTKTKGDFRETTVAVGSYLPNRWGLYDMHGNVWEWCADVYGFHLPGGSVTDPVGAKAGFYRVARGGSWSSPGANCRSANRLVFSPKADWDDLGFRVVLANAP